MACILVWTSLQGKDPVLQKALPDDKYVSAWKESRNLVMVPGTTHEPLLRRKSRILAAPKEYGFPGERRENQRSGRIFEKSYRGKEGLEKHPEGTGPGLYLAKKLAECMGGTLSLSESRSRGAVFVLKLPVGQSL